MSHKIGLGDTHFDPDINGAVDFAFFGDSDDDTAGETKKPSRLDDEDAKVRIILPRGTSKETEMKSSPRHPEVNNNRNVTILLSKESTEEIISEPMSSSVTSPRPDAAAVASVIEREENKAIESDVAEKTRRTIDDPESYASSSGSELSSFSDDSYSDDYEEDGVPDFESDSEITDVSPLSSANMSPLPESPKRTPEPRKSCASPRSRTRADESVLPKANPAQETDVEKADMKLLVRAIIDLEEKRKQSNSSGGLAPRSGRTGGKLSPNMTFTSDEVRRIDQENKRLLRRIIENQRPKKIPLASFGSKVASSAINRQREMKKIEEENLMLLKRLQAAKPTRDLSRGYLLRNAPKSYIPCPVSTCVTPPARNSSALGSHSTSSSYLMPAVQKSKSRIRSNSTGALSRASTQTYSADFQEPSSTRTSDKKMTR